MYICINLIIECGSVIKKYPGGIHRSTRSPIIVEAFNESENSVSFQVSNTTSQMQLMNEENLSLLNENSSR